jgi:hypothetical protein
MPKKKDFLRAGFLREDADSERLLDMSSLLLGTEGVTVVASGSSSTGKNIFSRDPPPSLQVDGVSAYQMRDLSSSDARLKRTSRCGLAWLQSDPKYRERGEQTISVSAVSALCFRPNCSWLAFSKSAKMSKHKSSRLALGLRSSFCWSFELCGAIMFICAILKGRTILFFFEGWMHFSGMLRRLSSASEDTCWISIQDVRSESNKNVMGDDVLPVKYQTEYLLRLSVHERRDTAGSMARSRRQSPVQVLRTVGHYVLWTGKVLRFRSRGQKIENLSLTTYLRENTGLASREWESIHNCTPVSLVHSK